MPKPFYIGSDQPSSFQEEDEGSTQFIAGFSSGLKQTQGLLGGGLPALISSAIGDDDATNEYLEYYNQKMQEAAEIGGDFERLEDIDGAEDAVQWLTYTLGQALPSIGTSVLSGGAAGALVQYGAKKFVREGAEQFVKKTAGKEYTKAKVKQEQIRRTAKVRRIGQTTGAFGASAGMNAAETFANVYEESGGIEDPYWLSAQASRLVLWTPWLRCLFSKKSCLTIWPSRSKKAWLTACSATREWLSAFMKGFAQAVLRRYRGRKRFCKRQQWACLTTHRADIKVTESHSSGTNNPTEQQKSQYLNAFAAGLVGGGGLGGISGAVYKPKPAPNEKPKSSRRKK